VPNEPSGLPKARFLPFRLVLHLEGELLIEQPFEWRGFEFKKTNAGMMAVYSFHAEDLASAQARVPEIEAALEDVLDKFAFVFNRSLTVTWVSEPLVPGPYGRASTDVLLDVEWLPRAADVHENASTEQECGRNVLLALRWYRKALSTVDCEDVFLTSWFALEALADHGPRNLTKAEKNALQVAKKALLNELPNDRFHNLRSLAAGALSTSVLRRSIPEAMTRTVRAVLGEDVKLLGLPAGRVIAQLQSDRSELVHHGKPIHDVCSKAAKLRELVRRVLSALVWGTHVIREVRAASIDDLAGARSIGEATAAQLVAHRDNLDENRGISQLRGIPGIGEARLQSLRKWAFERGAQR